jgi:hypothetical protein
MVVGAVDDSSEHRASDFKLSAAANLDLISVQDRIEPRGATCCAIIRDECGSHYLDLANYAYGTILPS